LRVAQLCAALVEPIGLIPPAPHRFDGAIDEVIVLEGPGDLAAGVAQGARGLEGLQIKDGVQAALAKSFLDPQGDQAHPPDLPGREQQPNQPRRDTEMRQSPGRSGGCAWSPWGSR